MRLSIVIALLALAATTSLAGCPRCPAAELETPSFSSADGGMEMVNVNGAYSYVLSTTATSGHECLVRPAGEIVDEDDLDGRVRSVVSIDCGTMGGPLLLVTLPDLRDTEHPDEPLAMSADVRVGDDCVAQVADLPIDITVVDAQGGPGVEPEVVTEDFLREVDSTLEITAGAIAGTRPDGSACLSQMPAITLALHLAVTSTDFDNRRGGGCG